MFKEFKKFIARGNVIDLAVGVIMGGAFGKIVTSLVTDILTPAIGIVMGGIDFTGLNLTIKDSIISYGNFIQNIIDFLIQAFCIFIFVKLINKFFFTSILKRKKNKKRWSIEGMLAKRKARFTPIKRVVIINRLASFEIEDNKIKFDIPCPK
jgi:large conductance mechanosensitive channel